MDTNQKQQTFDQSSQQVDDEYELVMELSEKDTLFEKKKKLFEIMRLDPKVIIKSNCSVESLNSILSEMMQRARIIHSDEVDLYFGWLDDFDPTGFVSQRNELESLYSILSLIDKSKTNDQQVQPKVFQDLRDATLDWIHRYGYKVKDDVKILANQNLDKEQCLLQWGESNGVKSKLAIAYFEGAGRGAIASEDLEVGDIALEIPVSVIISEDLVHKTSMFPVLEKVDGISSETMLLLWSMKEKHDINSKFRMYFDSLPKAFNTGLSFGINALMALEGTLLLEEIVQAKEHLRSQYDELVPSLCKNHPDIFPPELYTWEEFLWACELWYSNSMKIMYSDGKLKTCLVPIAGFLNHSVIPHIMHYGRVDSTTNSLKFPLVRRCKAGEQCYLTYGNLSSSHLITFYGFLTKKDNPYNVIPLDLDLSEAENDENNENNEDKCHIFNWSTHMVRATWFSDNHTLYHYGLPSRLLYPLRRARGYDSELDITDRENLEIELDIIHDLQCTFGDMMDNLGEPEPQVRENCDWDVKLALDYKDLQREILSSILDSCFAGRVLVDSLIRY